ncbi:MAG TPA: hypothetical protein V6D29_16680 [Leptolyngbyaceae cyanobacterium]
MRKLSQLAKPVAFLDLGGHSGADRTRLRYSFGDLMYPRRSQGKIFPKISTLPRQRTEAAHYLDMYKLTVEKKRLQQELQSLEQRQQRIQQRISEIDAHTLDLEDSAHQLRGGDEFMLPSEPSSKVYLPKIRTGSGNAHPEKSCSENSPDEFNMLFLEY